MSEQNAQAYWLRGSPPGHSDWPANTRVVSLDKRKYTREAAVARFAELKAAQGLRVWGKPFHTARFWCWRVFT